MLTENSQLRILYPQKTSFRNEGKIISFSDKPKLRDSVAHRFTLKEMFKQKVLKAEEMMPNGNLYLHKGI